MAKELPYFKFEPSAWDTGKIQLFDFTIQGIYINLCSLYWQRLGDLTYKHAVNKVCGGNASALQTLSDEDVIGIDDDKIVIKFLDEQLNGFTSISDKNRENAYKRWNKKNNAGGLRSHSERNAIREEKIREEKIKEENKKSKPNNASNKKIPTYEEFKEHALSKKNNVDQSKLKAKYESWVENGWKDGYDNQIKNWKAKLTNVVAYIPEGEKPKEETMRVKR
jgi:hypothetical protein